MTTASPSIQAHPNPSGVDARGHRLGSHDFRSRAIIKHEFLDAGCLITIGLDKIIIAPEDKAEFASDKFQKLMDSLRKVAESKSEKDTIKPILAWAFDAGKTNQAKTKAHPELKLLQSCLQNLERETADWLAERSIFIVANADRDWLAQSTVASLLPTHKYRTKKSTNADVFFRSIQQNNRWRSAEAITAFPSGRRQKTSRFFSHYAPAGGDWDQGPVAEELQPKSKNSCRFVRRICRIYRSDTETGLDKNVVSRLFDDGFAVFKFGELVKLKIK